MEHQNVFYIHCSDYIMHLSNEQMVERYFRYFTNEAKDFLFFLSKIKKDRNSTQHTEYTNVYQYIQNFIESSTTGCIVKT